MENENLGSNHAEGFRFLNEADAKLAQKEKKQVIYLQQRFSVDRPKEIQQFYEKAIHENIFKTPVGISYLSSLQAFLTERGMVVGQDLTPIPINYPCEKLVRPRKEKEHRSSSTVKKYLKCSLFLNIMLFIAVLFMLYVAKTSNHPNILNYERVITDQYAGWEEELKDREAVVREKEKEMKQWID